MTPRALGPLASKKTEERRQFRQDENVRDLQWLLEQPQFRRFVARNYQERCNAEGLVYDSSGSRMAFNDGRRSIGVELKREAKAVSRELWALAEKEWEAACDEDEMLIKQAAEQDAAAEERTNVG